MEVLSCLDVYNSNWLYQWAGRSRKPLIAIGPWTPIVLKILPSIAAGGAHGASFQYIPEEVNLEKVMSMLLIHDLGRNICWRYLYLWRCWQIDSYHRELESLKIGRATIRSSRILFRALANLKLALAWRLVLHVCWMLWVPAQSLKLLSDNLMAWQNAVIAKNPLSKKSETLWELALEVIDESVAKGLYLDSEAEDLARRWKFETGWTSLFI